MQISAIYPLQIWKHVARICKISKTNVLATSGLRDDNITGRSMGGGERESIVEIGRESEQRKVN